MGGLFVDGSEPALNHHHQALYQALVDRSLLQEVRPPHSRIHQYEWDVNHTRTLAL